MRGLVIVMVPALALAMAGCRAVGAPGHAAAPRAVATASGAAAGPSPLPSRSASAAAPRVLRLGMRGRAVRVLQRRLAVLKYYPGHVTGRFSAATLEAVWAFQATQGLHPRNAVDATMRRALASPRLPKVLAPHGGRLRVEVNMHDQVLVLYRRNHVALVSHVSTGSGHYFCSTNGCANAITPAGDFTTLSYLPGRVQVPLGDMYNPVFFLGTTFAIHGDTDVPLRPASHGCVRIPLDISAFFHTLLPIPGTPVYIRR